MAVHALFHLTPQRDWLLKFCLILPSGKNANVFKSLLMLCIMIIPIRCFSCGRPIAHLWEEYKKRVAAGEASGKVMDDLGVKDYCCRSMLIGHVDMIEKVSKFKKS